MTKEDLIRMAQEAGWEMDSAWDLYDGFNSRLERFANLVAAAERENVASWVASQRNDVPATGSEMAAALRARGEK